MCFSLVSSLGQELGSATHVLSHVQLLAHLLVANLDPPYILKNLIPLCACALSTNTLLDAHD